MSSPMADGDWSENEGQEGVGGAVPVMGNEPPPNGTAGGEWSGGADRGPREVSGGHGFFWMYRSECGRSNGLCFASFPADVVRAYYSGLLSLYVHRTLGH